jgi:hypothetical protein
MKKNIYLICYGTSNNDIIESINNYININNKNTIEKNKLKQNIISYFFSRNTPKSTIETESKITKINKNKVTKLFNLGIKELDIFQENEINNIFLSKHKNIYTSLDYQSIETAFILYHKIKDTTIIPISNTSNNNNIQDLSSLNRFKSYFGNNTKKNNTKTIINKYWDAKWNSLNLKNGYSNIKRFVSEINWKHINNKNIKNLNTYNFNNFELELIDIFKKEKDDIVIITPPNIIVDILKKIKNIKYNKNIDIIERSSMWNIEIEIDTKNNKIIYDNFIKVYPTEYNYKPLTYKITEYEYVYANKKFILFNSLNNIPLYYLKNITYNSFSKDEQYSIKKILSNNTNKKNNTSNISEEKSSSINFTFENFK